MKKIFTVFLLHLLFFISVYPQTSDLRNYQEYLKESYELINRGKKVEAIELLSEGINKFPNELSLYFRRAEIYRSTKQFDLMENDVNSALNVASDKYNAYVYAGVLFMGANKCDKALELQTNAINLDASKSNAFFNRASAHSCLKNFSGALNDLNYGLSIDPENISARAARNELMAKLGSSKPTSDTNAQLIESLEKQLQDDPENERYKQELSYMYLRRSRLFENEKNIPEMFADLNRAVEINPNFQLYSKRGALLYKYKYYEQAVRDFTKVIELKPEIPFSYMFRGDAYFRLEQFQNALKDYEKALTFEILHKNPTINRIEKTKSKLQEQISKEN